MTDGGARQATSAFTGLELAYLIDERRLAHVGRVGRHGTATRHPSATGYNAAHPQRIRLE